MIDRRLFLAGSAALGGCASVPRAAVATSDPWARSDAIAASVQRPRIGARVVRLAPEQADIRPAIHAAMATLGARGGRIIVPPGDWVSNGPIHLQSGIDLHVAAGATIRFSRDPAHYLPLVLTRWEGTECWNYSPLIYARGASDIAITGSGTIDGQGFEGFFQWRPKQRESQALLRKMGAEGTPVADRIFGPGHHLRPGFVQFFSCTRVLIDGPRFVDSTFWMIHPVYCDHVTVRNVTLKSDHLNSDGVDPDSSTNVLIEKCIFDVGDDGVAIKAGRDQDGWRVGRAASRIVVRDCVYRGTAGGGFSIGSEMSGGVSDVFVERYAMNDVVHGVYFKSNMDRGGAITDIFVRNIAINSAQAAISFTTDYHGHRGGNFPTRFDNVQISGVRCGAAIVGLSMLGAASAPLRRIRISDTVIERATTPLRSRNAVGMVFDGVRVNGAALAPVADTGPETFGDALKS
jgi:polygalacturonase